MATEAAAYLTGTLVFELRPRDRWSIRSVWLATLARGEPGDIERLAADAGRGRSGRCLEARTARYLATELLERVDQGHVDLHQVQRTLLVSLELRPEVATWSTAALADRVLKVLRDAARPRLAPAPGHQDEQQQLRERSEQ